MKFSMGVVCFTVIIWPLAGWTFNYNSADCLNLQANQKKIEDYSQKLKQGSKNQVDQMYQGLNEAASELRRLARQNSCDSQIIEVSSGALVKYGNDSSIKGDVFNFSKTGKLLSWVRQDRQGSGKIYNFDPEGRVIKSEEASK